MKHILHFLKRLIQNIFWAIIMFILSYGFLALCNGDLILSAWNGFSRFLVAICGLIIGIITWDAMSNTVRNIRANIENEKARKKSEKKQQGWSLDEIRPGD